MQIIKNQIKNLLKNKNIEVQFNIPPKELGDLSSAVALSLGKKENRNPMEIAEEIKAQIESKLEMISKVTVSAPGYLNFFIDYSRFGKKQAEKIIKDKTIFQPTASTEKISIEHTGVNPNKAMHIGHLRNSIIGDSVANLFKLLGYKTEVVNYIDDTGIQVADIVTAFLYLDNPIYTNETSFEKYWEKWNKTQSFDYFCWDLYTRFSQELETNEELEKRRREVFSLIEKGNSPIAKFAKEIATKIVEAQLKTLSKLNISFDLLVWESDILACKFWEETFELLKEKQLLVKEESGPNKGCWVVKAGGIIEKEDEQFSKDKILVKSDGTLTYTAKDLPYQIWKLGKLSRSFLFKKWDNTNISTTSPDGQKNINFGNADRVINVIDYRQAYPQEIIKDTLKKLGYIKSDQEYFHLSYGVVNLTEKAAEKIGITQDKKEISMSGRKGIGVKADDLINITSNEIDKKAKNKEISLSLANSAIRFYMTKFSTNQNINFDFDAALQTTGETGIYLSYSYARAINILKKSNYQENFDYKVTAITPSEKKLVDIISEYDSAIDSAKQKIEISEISKYAFKLCSTFAEFYEQKEAEPIYKTSDENIKNWRLALVHTFIIILKDLFAILGIEPLEQI